MLSPADRRIKREQNAAQGKPTRKQAQKKRKEQKKLLHTIVFTDKDLQIEILKKLDLCDQLVFNVVSKAWFKPIYPQNLFATNNSTKISTNLIKCVGPITLVGHKISNVVLH